MGKKKYFDIHGPVFWPASVLIVLFIAVTLIVGSPMAKVFSTVQSSITSNFGWLFIVAVNAFIVFCLYVGFGRFGKIRLGEKFDKFKEKLKLKEDCKCVVLEEDAHVSRALYDQATFNSADLVVIGNKGKADSNDLLIGSVAERLISHEKSIPVLIVKSSS